MLNNWKKPLAALGMGFLMLVGLAVTAVAQPAPQMAQVQLRAFCAPADDVHNWLNRTYGEVPKADKTLVLPGSDGTKGAPMAVVLYENEKTGSWTLVGVAPGGSCVLFVGSASGQPAQRQAPSVEG